MDDHFEFLKINTCCPTEKNKKASSKMMTDLDAAKLRAAYGCEGVERTTTTTITTTATTVGPIVAVPKLLANGNTVRSPLSIVRDEVRKLTRGFS